MIIQIFKIMNEKKFIITEQQLQEALQFAAMGGAGILPPNELTSIREKLPEEIAKMAWASALAAGCIRTEGPKGTILKILEMVAEDMKDKE